MPFCAALSVRAGTLQAGLAAARGGRPRPSIALYPRATRRDRGMNAPLLEVENLGRQFVAGRSGPGRPPATIAAVETVSFALQAGTTLALVGESGCGKTTLGRLVLRLIDPTAGRIRFDGRDVTGLKEHQLKSLRRNAQLIFQDPYASPNLGLAVNQILAEPLALHAVVPASRRGERVSELLRLVGL